MDAGRRVEHRGLSLGEGGRRQGSRRDQVGIGGQARGVGGPSPHPVAGVVEALGQSEHGRVGGGGPCDAAGDLGDRRGEPARRRASWSPRQPDASSAPPRRRDRPRGVAPPAPSRGRRPPNAPRVGTGRASRRGAGARTARRPCGRGDTARRRATGRSRCATGGRARRDSVRRRRTSPSARTTADRAAHQHQVEVAAGPTGDQQVPRHVEHGRRVAGRDRHVGQALEMATPLRHLERLERGLARAEHGHRRHPVATEVVAHAASPHLGTVADGEVDVEAEDRRGRPARAGAHGSHRGSRTSSHPRCPGGGRSAWASQCAARLRTSPVTPPPTRSRADCTRRSAAATSAFT